MFRRINSNGINLEEYSNSSQKLQRKFIKNSANETILEIRNIQTSDIGSYTLVAQNEAGRKDLSFTINHRGILISIFSFRYGGSIFCLGVNDQTNLPVSEVRS